MHSSMRPLNQKASCMSLCSTSADILSHRLHIGGFSEKQQPILSPRMTHQQHRIPKRLKFQAFEGHSPLTWLPC